ncbi:MAG: M28 family peptidase [Bacteroidetes bacterium]|nr:M28 family peptidase [Bacteroidota bacterium]
MGWSKRFFEARAKGVLRVATLVLCAGFAPLSGQPVSGTGRAADAAQGVADVTAGGAHMTASGANVNWTPDTLALGWMRELSDDAMQGRGAGTEGAARARAFIRDKFAAFGLEPIRLSAGGLPVYEDSFRFKPDRRGDSLMGVNLVGWLPGREFPEQFIAITAHYDHLGLHDGELFNGADDNASGVAALLSLALSAMEVPTRYSLLFIAFDAEEPGLLGAAHWVENPTLPLDRIRLNINLDMVARADKGRLWACGTRFHKSLRAPLLEAAAGSPLTLEFGHDGRTGLFRQSWISSSDHEPFHRAGIPFVYFGVDDHADYHKASDDFERIDPLVFDQSLQLLHRALRTLDAQLDVVLP